MEYWDFSYPLISEEYFDVGIEHRVRIFEWFLEKMHDCVLFMPVNSQDSQPDIEINFATLASAIKLDSVARRSGSGEAKLQELEGAGEITLRRFRKLLKQVPVQHVQFIGNTVKSVIENVAICEEFLAQKCGGQAPSFAKLKELLANITKTCDSVVAGPPQETIAIVAQRMGDITPEEGSADWGRADLAESEEGEPKKDAKNAGQNASQNASEGQNAEEIAIAGKADAYKALNDLADYLIEIDPQNPGPYLVKLVSTWHEKPFPELLDDIASGETHGHRVLKMIAELVKRN
jgi:hypothetical protein